LPAETADEYLSATQHTYHTNRCQDPKQNINLESTQSQGRFQGGREAAAPSEISGPLWPQKVQDKAATCQNCVYVYLVIQRESISYVPSDESVATPVAPKMKTPEPPLHKVQTSTKEYVLLRNDILVHNTEIRLITKIVGIIVLKPSEQ